MSKFNTKPPNTSDMFYFLMKMLIFFKNHISHGASLVAQLIKNLRAMREAWVRSLGWEDPLEKGTTTHSSILAWRIPWTV